MAVTPIFTTEFPVFSAHEWYLYSFGQSFLEVQTPSEKNAPPASTALGHFFLRKKKT